MRKKKYKALTLLEILVVLSLTGILLSSLWQIYHNWIQSSQTAKSRQEQSHKFFFLKQRLENSFFQMTAKSKEPFLFLPTSKDLPTPSLCLGYTGAPDPDLSFNGPLCSLLYVDDAEHLCFATWGQNEQCRVEILYDSVQKITFSCFNSKTNLWQKDWPKNLATCPLWVEILLHTKKNGIERLLFKALRPAGPILYLES